jgi:hypothetical protein
VASRFLTVYQKDPIWWTNPKCPAINPQNPPDLARKKWLRLVLVVKRR